MSYFLFVGKGEMIMGYKTTDKDEKAKLEKEGHKIIGYTIDSKTNVETYEFNFDGMEEGKEEEKPKIEEEQKKENTDKIKTKEEEKPKRVGRPPNKKR